MSNGEFFYSPNEVNDFLFGSRFCYILYDCKPFYSVNLLMPNDIYSKRKEQIILKEFLK